MSQSRFRAWSRRRARYTETVLLSGVLCTFSSHPIPSICGNPTSHFENRLMKYESWGLASRLLLWTNSDRRIADCEGRSHGTQPSYTADGCLHPRNTKDC